MRKLTLAIGLGAALLTGTMACAQSNTTIGVLTAAVAGAVAGGPVGVGGAAGGVVGPRPNGGVTEAPATPAMRAIACAGAGESARA
jgi:hypothetical protein